MNQSREETRFYALLGEAIARWQFIESSLCMLFCELMTQKQQDDTAAAVFYAPVNFKIKLALVHAAANIVLDKKTFDTWVKLHERLEKQSKKRNELAHFGMVHDHGTAHYRLGPRLRPNVFGNPVLKKKYGPKQGPSYTADDLEKVISEFTVLSRHVQNFGAEAADGRKPSP